MALPLRKGSGPKVTAHGGLNEATRDRASGGSRVVMGGKASPAPAAPAAAPQQQDGGGTEAPPTGGGARVAWRRGSYQARGWSRAGLVTWERRGAAAAGRRRGRGSAHRGRGLGGVEARLLPGAGLVTWERRSGAQARGPDPGGGAALAREPAGAGAPEGGGAGRGARAHVTSAAPVRNRGRAGCALLGAAEPRGAAAPARPRRPAAPSPGQRETRAAAPPRPAAASRPRAPSERALAPGERAGQPQHLFRTSWLRHLRGQLSQSWTDHHPTEQNRKLETEDPSFFSMGMWSIGAGALGAAALALLLANTDVFLSKSQKATLEYLEDIDLKTLEKEPRTFKAKELWEKNGAVIMAVRRPGCFLCREEAAGLSSLKPKLDELGVPLYAVVKEQIRTEVQDFQPYFKGEIFLDEKKKFYGPQRRKMMFMGFVRLGVWYNFFRARNGGFSGNLEGEGFILGGVFVVGSGKQGILLEHREKEFGDKVNPVSVLEAARKIQTQTSAAETK